MREQADLDAAEAFELFIPTSPQPDVIEFADPPEIDFIEKPAVGRQQPRVGDGGGQAIGEHLGTEPGAIRVQVKRVAAAGWLIQGDVGRFPLMHRDPELSECEIMRRIPAQADELPVGSDGHRMRIDPESGGPAAGKHCGEAVNLIGHAAVHVVGNPRGAQAGAADPLQSGGLAVESHDLERPPVSLQGWLCIGSE